MVGAIGSKGLDDVIIFEVSDERILTLLDFSRKNNVRFAKNDVLLKKPDSQFIGPGLDTISFKIDLRAWHGVNPRDEMDKLIHLQRDGETISVIIGKKPFGVYRWRIVDLNMVWKTIDNKGALTSAICEISLEEYV